MPTDRAQDTEAIRAARETLPRDLREWASSLDLAADRDRLPRGTAALAAAAPGETTEPQ